MRAMYARLRGMIRDLHTSLSSVCSRRVLYFCCFFFHTICVDFIVVIRHIRQLENVAIANALPLEAARATPFLFRFNYDAMPSLTSLNLSVAALQRFLRLIGYITLRCDFDHRPCDLDL